MALAGLAYLVMLALATALGAVSGRLLPVEHPAPWLALGEHASAVSLGLGLALALGVILSTRWLVERVAWARRLREDLRPLLHGATGAQLFALAVFSGVAEEWLFRGALQPLVGLVPATIVFGLAHLGPGRRFVAWALWAAAVGLALGAIFEATGSLAGAVLAHVAINAVNLRLVANHHGRLEDRPSRPAPKLVTDRVRVS